MFYKYLLTAFIILLAERIEAANYTNFGESVKNTDYVCVNPSRYGFINRVGTKKYYLIGDLLLNWADSENYCQKFGAHLPSILNKNDDDYIRSLTSNGADLINAFSHVDGVTIHSGVWLGGYLSTKNKWTWTDGNVFSYTNWGTGQPANLQIEPVLHLWYEKKVFQGWSDWKHTMFMNFICQLEC